MKLTLETKIERAKFALEIARDTMKVLRTARGPWATTNRRRNQKLVSRLNRELAALQVEQYRSGVSK